MRKCDKCKKDFIDSYIDEHHLLPKGIRKDNIDINEGKKADLCKKCHVDLHKILYWPVRKKDRNAVIKITEDFLK